MVTFRPAQRDDVPAIVALLADDFLGRGREVTDMAPYYDAFDQMAREQGNMAIVGEEGGVVVATYQLTMITGLSLSAARRAQIEGVRVARALRGKGVGRAMFDDAEARARAGGCKLIQLTMNAARTDSHVFYQSLGFEPSHTGWKRYLR